MTAEVSIAVEDEDTGRVTATPWSRIALGDLPEMELDGTFIVNGTSTAILSVLSRCPGILRELDPETGTWEVKIIPEKGPWVSVLKHGADPRSGREADPVVWCRVNRSKPFPATALLRALGADDDDLFNLVESIQGTRRFRLLRSKSGKGLALRELKRDDWVKVRPSEADGLVLTHDLEGTELEAGDALATPLFQDIGRAVAPGSHIEMKVVAERGEVRVSDTLMEEDDACREAPVEMVGALLAPSGSPPKACATAFEEALDEYSLGPTGRTHIKEKTGTEPGDGLCLELVELLVRELAAINGSTVPDDTYSLENRRIKTAGQLLSDALDQGFDYWAKETEKIVRQAHREATKSGRKKDDGTLRGVGSIKPEHIESPRYITAAMRRALLGAYAEKTHATNPVSGIMERRRTVTDAGQVLGSGRANPPTAARWVDDFAFRRLSASESPEGKNIGLVNYASMLAQPDRHGFLSCPARRVENGVATNDIEWLTPFAEKRARVALDKVNPNGTIRRTGPEGTALVRRHGPSGFEAVYVDASEITHAPVASDDSLAPAAALVPFVEHNDGTRMAMASAMTRQAVVCVRNERPYVGTGRERLLAEAAGPKALIKSRVKGTVIDVDAARVTVAGDGPDAFERIALKAGLDAVQGTLPMLRPAVRIGDDVEAGDPLAFGESVRAGGIALGQNLKVAYMPWRGLNFEDAIVVSEQVVRDGKLESVHIRRFSCRVAETLLGPEELTDDLPDVPDSERVNLDADGIVKVGARVREGDLLVGKVAPKDPSGEETAEEKLLRMVFSKTWGNVKDKSLRLPMGYDGAVVTDVRSMAIRGPGSSDPVEPTDRESGELDAHRAELLENLNDMAKWVRDRLLRLAAGQQAVKARACRREAASRGAGCRRCP